MGDGTIGDMGDAGTIGDMNVGGNMVGGVGFGMLDILIIIIAV